jgi:hypothetical protein
VDALKNLHNNEIPKQSQQQQPQQPSPPQQQPQTITITSTTTSIPTSTTVTTVLTNTMSGGGITYTNLGEFYLIFFKNGVFFSFLVN